MPTDLSPIHEEGLILIRNRASTGLPFSRGRTAYWRARLEESYEPGPVASALCHWRRRVPIWLLSNHRSHWLIPRLERFGLRAAFDRLLVSDALGVAKPSPRVFAPVLGSIASPDRVLFIDDQEPNLHSARAVGLRALPVTQDPQSVTAIDLALGGPGRPAADEPHALSGERR